MFPLSLLRRLRGRPGGDDEAVIEAYLRAGSVPWSPGYKTYKRRVLREVLNDPHALRLFSEEEPLPTGYGRRLDERVVEYPWVLSRLAPGPLVVLDAGSTLNAAYLLELPVLSNKKVTIMTLSAEGQVARRDVSYVYGDLRRTGLPDAAFDAVVCISTLEHIGLDNNRFYTGDVRFREASPNDYQRAVAEFQRVLKPGGSLLLTVPFGRPENRGWFQQFDAAGLDLVARAFGGPPAERTFYRYDREAWTLSTPEACAECEYFDVHAAEAPAADGAAAARAVACLRFVKPDHDGGPARLP